MYILSSSALVLRITQPPAMGQIPLRHPGHRPGGRPDFRPYFRQFRAGLRPANHHFWVESRWQTGSTYLHMSR